MIKSMNNELQKFKFPIIDTVYLQITEIFECMQFLNERDELTKNLATKIDLMHIKYILNCHLFYCSIN